MSDAENPIEIRRLDELEDLRRVEDLQGKVWGFTPLDVVPARLMRVASRSGTLVFGAFDGKGELVAFVYGFPGMREGRLIFCSHMLAVRPGLRDRGLGVRLKLAQREWLLDHPVDLVSWTFDPLEVKNGFLNLTKLGATSSEYIENLYGKTSSPLHGGLDPDRLVIHWAIRSGRVEERVGGGFDAEEFDREVRERIPLSRAVNETRRGELGVRLCLDVHLGRSAEQLLIEVPRDASVLRTRLLAEGRIWQERLRTICHHYFGRGYAVTAVVRRPEEEETRCFYLLELRASE